MSRAGCASTCTGGLGKQEGAGVRQGPDKEPAVFTKPLVKEDLDWGCFRNEAFVGGQGPEPVDLVGQGTHQKVGGWLHPAKEIEQEVTLRAE